MWTTIILILMQTYKDVKPRPRPPPRTRAPTVDVGSIPTPSSRGRATSRPPTNPNLSSSSSARLIADPSVESPRGTESNNAANAKRPPPVPRTSKPALTFKKSPAVNSDGNAVESPKKLESPPSSNNSNVSAEPKTPTATSSANKTNDLAAYDDDKEVNIDDVDLGDFGGDDFDADNYFKKLAKDLVRTTIHCNTLSLFW